MENDKIKKVIESNVTIGYSVKKNQEGKKIIGLATGLSGLMVLE